MDVNASLRSPVEPCRREVQGEPPAKAQADGPDNRAEGESAATRKRWQEIGEQDANAEINPLGAAETSWLNRTLASTLATFAEYVNEEMEEVRGEQHKQMTDLTTLPAKEVVLERRDSNSSGVPRQLPAPAPPAPKLPIDRRTP